MTGEKWVGLWHHVNVEPGGSHEFDDHQGSFLEEAGPFPILDPVDLVLMAAFDAVGLSVDHDASRGVERYQALRPDDGLPATRPRGKGGWQQTTVPHVPFEPVDNLAYYGWRRFREEPDHPVRYLGWPLHAIGDAIVPMHVAGTAAWGHRPFEDSQVNLWPAVRLEHSGDGDQRAFVERILERALIEDWRLREGRPTDVPVRLLVTELALDTRTYSLDQDRLSAGGWPYSITASTHYLLDITAANRAYEAKDPNGNRVRPLFEDGIGATIALLVAAADSLPE